MPGETPLLWTLRDELGMTGTKFDAAWHCAAPVPCTWMARPFAPASPPLSAAAGRAITTIEGVAADPVGQAVQQAWIAQNVAQCGYCQAGQIMTAVSLLKTTAQPTDQDIEDAMSGNLCRCGTYPRIRAAIHQAAQLLAQGGKQ